MRKLGPSRDGTRMVWGSEHEGDSFDELAVKVGLLASEHERWASAVNPDEANEGDEVYRRKYSVPNLWISANFLNGSTLWERFVNIGAQIGKPISDLGPRLHGKKVITTTSAARLPELIKAHRSNIWGIVIYGHGARQGYLGNYPGTDGTSQQEVIAALRGDYKIALAQLMQCFSLYSGWDTNGPGAEHRDFSAAWSEVAIDSRGYRHRNVLGLDVPARHPRGPGPDL